MRCRDDNPRIMNSKELSAVHDIALHHHGPCPVSCPLLLPATLSHCSLPLCSAAFLQRVPSSMPQGTLCSIAKAFAPSGRKAFAPSGRNAFAPPTRNALFLRAESTLTDLDPRGVGVELERPPRARAGGGGGEGEHRRVVSTGDREVVVVPARPVAAVDGGHCAARITLRKRRQCALVAAFEHEIRKARPLCLSHRLRCARRWCGRPGPWR